MKRLEYLYRRQESNHASQPDSRIRNPILDDMTHTRPKADPVFQQQLEDRLVNHLLHQGESEITMQHHAVFPQSKPVGRRRFPLTLAAASIAVLLVFSVLLTLSSQAPNSTFPFAAQGANDATAESCVIRDDWPLTYTVQEGDTLFSISRNLAIPPETLIEGNCLAADAILEVRQVLYVPLIEAPMITATPTASTTWTATPAFSATWPATPTWVVTATPVQPENIYNPTAVPAGLEPVVIALRPISWNSPLTADMLIVTYWPIGFAPEASFSSIESAVGLFTRRKIDRWDVIVNDDLASESQTNDQAAVAVLPAGMVAVAVPNSSPTLSVKVGDTVDVIASYLFIDIDPSPQTPVTPAAEGGETQKPRLMTQVIAKDALVIHIGAFPTGGTSSSGDESLITLAVTPDEAVMLQWAVDSQVPIIFAVK